MKDFPIEPLKLSLQQIAQVTGECQPNIQRAIDRGHLKTFIVGRRRFARPDDVRAWIDLLEQESDAGRPVVYQPRSADSKE